MPEAWASERLCAPGPLTPHHRGLSPPTGSPRSYSLGPEVQFLVDELDELRVAEGEEIDDFIDSSQKLIPPEVSLRGQIRGGVNSVTQTGIKAITEPQWGRYGDFYSFRMAKGIPSI